MIQILNVKYPFKTKSFPNIFKEKKKENFQRKFAVTQLKVYEVG